MKKLVLLLLNLVIFSYVYGAEDQKLIAAVGSDRNVDGGGFVPGEAGPQSIDQIDPKILRDFVESRGLISCRQKCGSLVVAGDARAKWIVTGERVKGRKARGAFLDEGNNRFKTEFNLYLDYVDPKSWVSTKVKWFANMGSDGGSPVRTELDRAFIGYDIYECGKEDFYVELGRSRLEFIFDSRVEFNSYFDGIHFYYTNCWDRIGTFTIHGGPFIVDPYTNHYAEVVETEFDLLGGTGWSVQYSIINWHRHAPTLNYGNIKEKMAGKNGYGPESATEVIRNNPRYRFLVSQLLIGYEKEVNFFGCKTLFLYGAVLANHDAKRNPSTANKYANKAWYVGFTLGKLCKAYDWSLDVNYQYVQAQAVPEFDLSGFGHGNGTNYLLSDAQITGLIASSILGIQTNYHGPQILLMYALSNTVSVRMRTEWSHAIDDVIGGPFKYKNFEMAFIYAF